MPYHFMPCRVDGLRPSCQIPLDTSCHAGLRMTLQVADGWTVVEEEPVEEEAAPPPPPARKGKGKKGGKKSGKKGGGAKKPGECHV
jgi:hypothetical protein